jgi:ATP-binding cassette subfamily B protein
VSEPTSPSGPLRRLWRYAAPHRGTVVAASACSVLNKFFDLAPPALIGAAVDVVHRKEESVLGALGLSLEGQLWVLAAITFVIWGAESVFQYAYGVLWRNLAQTVQHELRLDAYGHVQGLELAWFEDRSTGGLMAVLNDDVNQLERFLDTGANDLWQVATTVLVIPIAFFILAPSVAWMSMVPIPFILFGSIWYQRRLAPRYAAVRDRVGLLNHQLANNLGGIATIKSFTQEDAEVERIRAASEAYRVANRAAIKLSSAFGPLIRMVIVCGFLATLIWGGKLVFAGQLTVAAYSVMVFLTQRLLWPLTRIGDTFDQYQRAMASTNRVLDLLDTPNGMADGPGVIERATLQGAVALEGASFRYRTGGDVLHTLDLQFPSGQTTAIVGSTGAGKSTLVKLLLRFYDPTAGRVTLDGCDLQELQMASLRSVIGLVSQDVFLFHGTVRENIAFGRRDADAAAIEAAARAAEAHDFISALPEGYETVVGERGQKLSGGQRQRISIARAVLKDPAILMLDEATSSVDNETEAAIQRSLAHIAVGRTVIAIAHRLSTIRHADNIYVLEHGQVSESGTHEALLEAGGIYAALWRVQTGEALSQRP